MAKIFPSVSLVFGLLFYHVQTKKNHHGWLLENFAKEAKGGMSDYSCFTIALLFLLAFDILPKMHYIDVYVKGENSISFSTIIWYKENYTKN